jgi:hypothetical protein
MSHTVPTTNLNLVSSGSAVILYIYIYIGFYEFSKLIYMKRLLPTGMRLHAVC